MASAGIQQHVLVLLMQLVVFSVFDYGLGMLTLNKTQVERLERLQNAAMRAVLGCTMDTHVITMRYLLDLTSIRVRHRLAQVKMYLNVVGDPDHPLHENVGTVKGSRIKRGRSWMAEAEESLSLVCDPESIKGGKEWVELGSGCKDLTKVRITMGRERRECAATVNEMEIRQLIEDNSRPADPVIYTDGSVRRGERSGWGFVAYIDGKKVHSAAGAVERTTSSMKMESEAITRALDWLHLTRTGTTHLVVVTDSQSVLKKVERGFLRQEWVNTLDGSTVRSITWIFCPGHSGVKGNEEADQMAGNAPITEDVRLDRDEILRRLEQHLRDAEEKETEEHHALVRMRGNGFQRGKGKKLRLAGKERRWYNQTATGTISMATLRAVMMRGTEHLWTCPMCEDVVLQDK